MEKSNFARLNLRDLLRGAVVAAGTAAGTIIAASLKNGELPTARQLQIAAGVGVCAGMAYLAENFFTNHKGGIGPER
jgi:hypothetical protein